MMGALDAGLFTRLGEAEFNRSVRHGHALSMLAMSVEHNKSNNRQISPGNETQLLSDLIFAWRRIIRDHDLLGRLNGRRFGVLLPDTDAQSAMNVAKRLAAVSHDIMEFDDQTRSYFKIKFIVSELSPVYFSFQDLASDLEHKFDSDDYFLVSENSNSVA